MTDTPDDYWCKTTSLLELDINDRKRVSIPYDELKGTYSKCSRYAVNWKEIFVENDTFITANASWPVETCVEGWEFNTTDLGNSIVTQVN